VRWNERTLNRFGDPNSRPRYEAGGGAINASGREPTAHPVMRCYSRTMNKTAKSGGAACVRNADGTYSADALHEQMTAGIDDADIRARTRAHLHAKGIPAAALNGLFPDLPPLPAT
jgi:hypothetical protein